MSAERSDGDRPYFCCIWGGHPHQAQLVDMMENFYKLGVEVEKMAQGVDDALETVKFRHDADEAFPM